MEEDRIADGYIPATVEMKMTKPAGAFEQELDDLVRRFAVTVSNDELAAVLISRALLVHLRTTNMEGAMQRIEFMVAPIERPWRSAEATAA